MLTYGSEKLDRVTFQQQLDAIGAREAAGTDFAVASLAEHFDRGVELLADNELHPALPEQALNIIKTQVAHGVAARNRSPGFLTQHSLRGALYPQSDPSLRMATPESVTGLTPDTVRAYYRSVFRPDLTTIVIIGKVTPAQARATVEKYFNAWSVTGAKPEVDLPVAPPNRAGVIAVPDASRVQDVVILAQNLALTRSDPDYYPLQLGNAVLGGSFYSTRLSIDLRKNSGLVYSVRDSLASTAIELLCGLPTDRARVCRGDHCGWLFIDSSKGGQRVWCDMATCGNAAKTRRHQKNAQGRRHAG